MYKSIICKYLCSIVQVLHCTVYSVNNEYFITMYNCVGAVRDSGSLEQGVGPAIVHCSAGQFFIFIFEFKQETVFNPVGRSFITSCAIFNNFAIHFLSKNLLRNLSSCRCIQQKDNLTHLKKKNIYIKIPNVSKISPNSGLREICE